nr:sigma-70 family RNA polymerase sigma factor [Candidatus Eremiobacteraeota bacterium]
MFEQTYPAVVRYARHRGLSGHDLEDLVAGTYEVAWRRFDVVPGGDQALPWLFAVALNHLRNHRRRVIRDRSLLGRLRAPEPVPAPSEPTSLSWRNIRAGLEQLSADDRELLLLIAWDGLGPAEAAAVLGVSAAAVRTRLHRARARFADALALEHPLEPPAESTSWRERTHD